MALSWPTAFEVVEPPTLPKPPRPEAVASTLLITMLSSLSRPTWMRIELELSIRAFSLKLVSPATRSISSTMAWYSTSMMSRSFSGTRSIQTWLGSLSALAMSSEEEPETSPHVPTARAAMAARATNLDDFDIGQMVTQLAWDGKVSRHAAAYTRRKSASEPLPSLQRNREQY